MRSLIILSAFMACASAFSYDGFKLLRLRENSVTDTALLRLVHDAKNNDHARLVDSDKRQVYLPPGKAGERLLKRLVRLQIYFPKKKMFQEAFVPSGNGRCSVQCYF